MTRVAFALCLLLTYSAIASAQGGSWEVEGHGGGWAEPAISGGTASVPPAGTPFVAGANVAGTTFQSRRVSSWFFGDGSQLLNGAAAVMGTSARLTPLDGVFSNPLGDRTSGRGFGLRVSRALTGRLSAEFNLDYATAPFEVRNTASAGINATRDSFRPAFEGVLPPALFVGRNPAATSVIEAGNGREIATTGTLRLDLRTGGRLIPYATVGAGLTTVRGDGPSAALEGGYAFQLANVFPFNERDRVTLSQVFDETSFVTVLGGGVRAHVSQRSGIRVDVRAHLSPARDRVLLDANPSVASSSVPFQIFSATSASLSFSSFPQPSAFPPSTLSGPALDDVTVYEVTRTRRPILITVGYFVRF